MTCTKGIKACLFFGHFIGCLVLLSLLNFILSIWPYYLQYIVHRATKTNFLIDNFNLYVIGYTLFLIVITYFAPIIKKGEHILWSLLGAAFLILFVISTGFLGFEYHDYITKGQNYSKELRDFSFYMANIFIGINVFLSIYIVLEQSIRYSLSKMKKVNA